MKIAICDDQGHVRDALARILRPKFPTAHIVEAADWGTTLAACGHTPFDLVVVEPAMPGMAPLTGLKALQCHDGGHVAVLSRIDDPKDICRMFACGASGYIPKSFRIASVEAALQLIIAGEIFVPASVIEARMKPCAHAPAAVQRSFSIH
ncbi:MAG: response regulator [Actinomycetota bacterium]